MASTVNTVKKGGKNEGKVIHFSFSRGRGVWGRGEECGEKDESVGKGIGVWGRGRKCGEGDRSVGKGTRVGGKGRECWEGEGNVGGRGGRGRRRGWRVKQRSSVMMRAPK